MRNVLLPLLFFLLLLPCVQAAEKAPAAGDISVEAEGYGATRDDALLQAKRGAIEKGIGSILVSQTEVNNFTLQKDLVITQTFGAVRHYKILREKQAADRSWQVAIEALVSLDSIRADLVALKILLESMDKPRMMVLVKEPGGNVAETTVIDYLKTKGFDLVDPAQTAALMQKDEKTIERAIQGDAVVAAKIGAAAGAEYVLVGTVSKSTKENALLQKSGMVSGQAAITARVVNSSNARIVASKSATGAAAHISPDIAQALAVEKAAGKLMDERLFEQILTSFQDTVNNGATLDVAVRNVVDYKSQKAVTRLLQVTKNVVSVSQRSFGGGELRLSVQYKGTATAFCDLVDGKGLGGRKITVQSVTGNNIGMQLK